MSQVPCDARQCIELFPFTVGGQQQQDNDVDWLTIDCTDAFLVEP